MVAQDPVGRSSGNFLGGAGSLYPDGHVGYMRMHLVKIIKLLSAHFTEYKSHLNLTRRKKRSRKRRPKKRKRNHPREWRSEWRREV